MAHIHSHKDDACCSNDAYCCDNFPIARVGEQAPCFAGTAFINGEIKEISLEDYKGKWVVFFFYPADFTFVCPTELGGLADVYDDLKKKGVEVISCSTDTEWCHKVWADISPVIKTVKYPMLADPSGVVCEAYGVYQENGLAQRGRFIIDPDGVIKSIEITDGPLGRNTDEIIRQLEALQHMRKHPGMACPMSWKPGAKDLKPGIDLAGKI